MRGALCGALICLFWPVVATQADSMAEAEKNAEALQATIQKNTGSAAIVERSALKPMSSSTPMSTFDGKQQFSAQIQQHADRELLKLTIQPQPSGDVKILSIAQDTRLAGKIDHYSQPNVIVSGVCANGFIRCDPGSWNNCQSFAWTTTANQKLAIQQVPISSLGGCYCINNSCGTGLAWSNLQEVLAHLGGGAVGAIVKQQPFYSVGSPKIVDTQVIYHGHNKGEKPSANLPDLAEAQTPQQLMGYAQNPQKLEEVKAAHAKNDPIWQMIKGSQENAGPSSFVGCSIDRLLEVDTVRPEEIVLKLGGSGTLSFIGNDQRHLKLTMGDTSQKWGEYRMYEEEMMLDVRRPDRITYARLGKALFDDWLQILISNVPIWSGPYNNWWDPVARPPGPGELAKHWDQDAGTDFASHLKQGGLIQFKSRLEVTGCGHGYIDATIGVDPSDRLKPDNIINGCTAFEGNPDYLLVDENIDGVQTFRGHAKTGLRPMPQTRTIKGPNSSFNVTRDWFKKQRRYLKKSQAAEKFQINFDRTRYIQEQSNDRTYRDRYQDPKTGKINTTQGGLFSTDAKPFEACTPTCKTKRPRPQHDVHGDGINSGVTGEKQRHPVTFDFFYRPCQNGVCQIGPGEELVKPCQCLQEFGEAASMMQMMRLAGSDLICSTGNTKNLSGEPERVPPNDHDKKNGTPPNWMCGKEQEGDGTARLQNCVPGENNQMVCPVDAVECLELTRTEQRVERREHVTHKRFLFWKRKKVSHKNVVIPVTIHETTCPIGAQYPCVRRPGHAKAMCSPHACVDLATTTPTDAGVDAGETMEDDGRRDANGECLDQLYIYNGVTGFCRPPGIHNAWKDCCKNKGKVVSDSTSGSANTKLGGAVAKTLFSAGKAAFTAFKATQGGLAVAAKAGALAAKKMLIVGLDPATLAASLVIGFTVDYLTTACEEADMKTALMNGNGFCVEVGSYCKQHIKLIGCVQRAKGFCCFNSKMARIIHEQGRSQLKTFNGSGFGSPENPECRGFTPEEFQSIDFSRIDLSEYVEDLQRTLQPEMQRDMEKKVQEFMQKSNQ